MKNNKTFGSMLIIAGTTIGAGMLALPLASAGLGFGVASILMLLLWGLMSYTALLMLEVHQHAPAHATLHTLAHKLLGRKGQLLASLAMMFLLYALCAAYIAGGGAQLHDKLVRYADLALPPQVGAIGFALLIALVVAIGTHSVDMINRVLFALKIIALVIMLTLLLPHAQGGYLLELPLQQGLVISALPVIFTSFGFHGSIPSVVRYVGLDLKALKKIMLVGSAMPLLVYLLWQLASQGALSQSELMASKELPKFINSLGQLLHNPMIGQTVSIFADLALATSFLGVSLGLFDFMGDILRRNDSTRHRLQTAAITFLPPLGFALFYPQGFMAALGYAAIALVILAVFLPVAMVWKQRCQPMPAGSYRVGGGKPALVLAALCGVVIILSQLLQMAGILTKVG
ncbi:aromatic amino acid transport family protein [Shewanella chilikensis]|uniref:aromatic amino acid transport family protein n=1 Tax=Shewanella chilikensis TaxID=558541 RepID=UPI001CD22BF5|nr:aromatic amino acid transport family protein [Shewanella chilikensis]MCA0949005.1 aromatic amino acid transporter [Shewanella chilikensis]